MRISDWSSDVCASDLIANGFAVEFKQQRSFRQIECLHQLGMQLADPAAPLRAAHDARGAAGMQSGMRGGFESIFVSDIAEQGDNLNLEVIEISRTAGACPLLRQGQAGARAGAPRGFAELGAT